MVLATAIAIFGVAATPAARADEYDFVADFEEDGVHYASIGDLLGLGYLACTQLADGTDVKQVFLNLIDAEAQVPPPRLDGGPGYSSSTLRGVSIVTSAVFYLCPEQRHRVEQFTGVT